MRDRVQILHIKIGQTEVDVSVQTSILAVESSVDQLGDELAGEGNNEGVGYNGDPRKRIFFHEMNDNWLYLPKVSMMSSHTPML